MHEEFLAFLGPRANLNIAAITQKDILDFRDQREAKGLAPVTLNLDVTVLSAAFNAALGQGHIRVNPFRGIEALKDKATHKKVFTPEQVSTLLSAADGHWRGIILLGFYCGMRLNDAAIWAGVTSTLFHRLRPSHTSRARPVKQLPWPFIRRLKIIC
jgi:integrase